MGPRGAIVRALHRTARKAGPTYEALCHTVRGSPMVTPDETGWRVGGRLHWLWAFATPDTTVDAIRKGRGFPEAASILGADFAGVLVRDGWAPYRPLTRSAPSSTAPAPSPTSNALPPISPWSFRPSSRFSSTQPWRRRTGAPSRPCAPPS